MTQTFAQTTDHLADEAVIAQLWDQLTPVFDDILASAPARDAAGGIDPAPVEQLRQAGLPGYESRPNTAGTACHCRKPMNSLWPWPQLTRIWPKRCEHTGDLWKMS